MTFPARMQQSSVYSVVLSIKMSGSVTVLWTYSRCVFIQITCNGLICFARDLSYSYALCLYLVVAVSVHLLITFTELTATCVRIGVQYKFSQGDNKVYGIVWSQKWFLSNLLFKEQGSEATDQSQYPSYKLLEHHWLGRPSLQRNYIFLYAWSQLTV